MILMSESYWPSILVLFLECYPQSCTGEEAMSGKRYCFCRYSPSILHVFTQKVIRRYNSLFCIFLFFYNYVLLGFCARLLHFSCTDLYEGVGTSLWMNVEVSFKCTLDSLQ